MDAQRFDTFSRTLAKPGTRRGLLHLLPALSLAGTVPVLVAELTERAAAHPVERVQKRRDHHRKRARRRQEQRHEQRTRDNGQGSEDGNLGAGFTCVPIDQICTAFGNRCCGKAHCNYILGDTLGITTCQQECRFDEDCREKWFGKNVKCVADKFACPDFNSCCRPKICESNADCQGGGKCCPTLLGYLTGEKRCCDVDEDCAVGGGCRSA
jgi:hypothetical protein